MKRLKENILRDNQLSTSFSAGNSMPSTSSSTNKCTPSTSSCMDNSMPSTPSYTARPSDTCIYGVGIVAILAIGVCVFFCLQQIIKQKTSHHNEQQQTIKPKRHML